MLRKVLVANRGEIAVRIIRTARRLGIATVAVFSDADDRAMHVAQADEAVHIGPSPASESYLDVGRIIEAAQKTGADCIHPGYGFLSEAPALADACAEAAITLIGPSAAAMRQLGDKAAAKALATAAGIPTVPGYDGTKQDLKSLAKEAQRIGFPLFIKAVAGGGGRGLRIVEGKQGFADALASAQREALAAFGDGRVLLEKLVERPRHVEVQVFADTHGQTVHLFERDCSLQRRHQKVIEEAPAPGMSAGLRAALCEAAVKLAKAARYAGAGTVEFLVDGGNLDENAPWFFIEMNTRLQVEHPVTELITGLDLVEWQFRVASGEPLPRTQDQIAITGHAIEARIYAEAPEHGFRPCVGRLLWCELPSGEGIRVDTGVGSGDVITAFYDPMIAKVIAGGIDRETALNRLSAALLSTRIAGPETNTAFLIALANDADMRSVHLDTGLIERSLQRLTQPAPTAGAIIAGAALLLERKGPTRDGQSEPWDSRDAFQFGPPRQLHFDVLADGTRVPVLARWPNGTLQIEIPTMQQPAAASPNHTIEDGERILVLHEGRQTIVEWPHYAADDATAGGSTGAVVSPITGRLAKVAIAIGDQVRKGDRIAVVEAMKMEYVLHAGCAGRITNLPAALGAQIPEGAVIAEIEPVGPADDEP